MTSVQIRRQVLRFGHPLESETAGSEFVYTGVPGPPSNGGVLAPPADATLVGSFKIDPERAARRMAIPKINGQPPIAIAIAPDSAIQSCDLAVGGSHTESTRHRISPGNPFIGDLDADFATVTLPNSIPSIVQGDRLAIWDSVDINGAGSFPLRLELWYGALPVRTVFRAPYVASFIAEISPDSDATERDLYVCVDGRQRVDVVMFDATGSGSNTFSCYAVEPFKKSSPSNYEDDDMMTLLPLNAAGDTAVAISQNENNATRVSFNGTPMTVLRIRLIPDGSSGDTIHVRVKAYDD